MVAAEPIKFEAHETSGEFLRCPHIFCTKIMNTYVHGVFCCALGEKYQVMVYSLFCSIV